MNTNEFYKELFEKYAFDEEKIRRNAIKAAKTPVWKRTLGAHWKTALGAAAAVAVTAGGVIAYTAVNPSGNIDIVTSEDMLSASRRIHDAEQNYYSLSTEKTESKQDVYVSFMDVLSYSDILVSLSAIDDSAEIEILCLYLADGTKISGKEAVAEYAPAYSSAKEIIAVKLCAPAECYRDIWDLSSVYLSELASDTINDDTFVPIRYDDSDPLQDNEFIITTAQQPSVTTTSFAFSGETAAASSETAKPVTVAITDDTTTADTTIPLPESDTASHTQPGTSGTEETGISEITSYDADAEEEITVSGAQMPEVTDVSEDSEDAPEETEDTEETEEGFDLSEITEPEEDADGTGIIEIEDDDDDEPEEDEIIYVDDVDDPEYVTAAETSVPVTEITDTPELGLMTQIYQLNVENALDTLLIDNYAIVLTRGDVYFYTLGGLTGSQPKICHVGSPKIAYTDKNTVIVTGVGTDGLRNVIVTFDMVNNCVYSSDAAAGLGSVDIASICRSVSDNVYFLKAISASSTYLYELTVNAQAGISLRPLAEINGAVSLGGYSRGMLWFTSSDDNINYRLYSFDCVNGILTLVKDFGSDCRIHKSRTFESFIITGTDAETGSHVSYIFDTSAGVLIPAELSEQALIAVQYGSVYVKDGSANYVLSGGTLTETTTSVAYTEYYGSNYSIVSTDPEKIVVADNGWH